MQIKTYDKIMIASDGSPSAQRAEDVALSLARGLDSTVVAVHIIDEKLILPFEVLEEEGKKILKLIRLKGEKIGVRVDDIIIFGNPGVDIAKITTKAEADLLVIGAHGRSGLEKLLRGSVAEKALHTVEVPVILVK